MLGGFYFSLTEIRTTFLIQINCKSYDVKIQDQPNFSNSNEPTNWTVNLNS